ncbi:hypothetical protein GGR53DRAFT_471948 [Hypoxylon sp. FL1150]|nr:hypothetical protein GGR53DRAFT_471948 [Hypoxylon sp. FL1150]
MCPFHHFSRLPSELRVQIWAMTVEPRVVEVRVVPDVGPRDAMRLFTSTPVPAILQTCREARYAGLYKREFAEITPADEEQRYVWLNLDIDMVSIGQTEFSAFEPVAPSVKRLRFERENSYEFYLDMTMDLFKNMHETHVVCLDGMESWHGAIHEHPWHACLFDDLWFIDSIDGRMMKGPDMQEMLDERLGRWEPPW